MANTERNRELHLLRSKLAALEELLAEQERTVAEQSARIVRAREEALEATRAKSEFLARMSHELRTPLNSVIGFSNVLLKNRAGSLLPQDTVYIERIRQNGTHLLQLINSILDLSKIEAQKMVVQNETVELCGLVRETVAQLQGHVEGGDVRVTAECPQGAAPVVVDSAKLKQVIINLVGNALKFTERGSVTVRVDVDPATRRPTRIEVIDTGIGVPPDKLEKIFDAFEQVDGSSSREHVGTGLGLAISKSFCDLMGHRIEVESEPGVGSTFRVVLGTGDAPPAPLDVLPSAKPTERAAPRTAPGLTALVIDDEADSRLLLTHQLEELGVQVITVGSGEEGLRVARRRKPDLITLDLMMPEMGGLEVLRRLKAHPELREVPVIIVSMGVDKSGSLLGAIESITKPVSREALADVLGRLTPQHAGTALVVDDDPDACEILTRYLQEEGLRVRTAPNGRAALELLEVFSPDVITLDLMMPEMDGLAFIRELRRDERYLDVPVIVVSARELSAEEERRLSAQVQAVLQKSEQIEENLRKLIRAQLGPRRG